MDYVLLLSFEVEMALAEYGVSVEELIEHTKMEVNVEIGSDPSKPKDAGKTLSRF